MSFKVIHKEIKVGDTDFGSDEDFGSYSEYTYSESYIGKEYGLVFENKDRGLP